MRGLEMGTGRVGSGRVGSGQFALRVGEWRFGFGRSIGRCLVLDTELWAILDGLRHVWHLGFHRVQLESDCSRVIGCIMACDHVHVGHYLVMVVFYRRFFVCWYMSLFCSVCRSANVVVDGLATSMRGQLLKEMIFLTLPAVVHGLVQADLSNLFYILLFLPYVAKKKQYDSHNTYIS
ncbi:hypothetical protein GQ457_02G018720 [Hibiscus cannabinus]